MPNTRPDRFRIRLSNYHDGSGPNEIAAFFPEWHQYTRLGELVIQRLDRETSTVTLEWTGQTANGRSIYPPYEYRKKIRQC